MYIYALNCTLDTLYGHPLTIGLIPPPLYFPGIFSYCRVYF